MTQRTTWAQVLDDYAVTIAALEQRLDADAWADAFPPFSPPAEPPSSAPTPAQVERFEGLRRRAEECEARARGELNQVRTDIAGMDVRREAARTYLPSQ